MNCKENNEIEKAKFNLNAPNIVLLNMSVEDTELDNIKYEDYETWVMFLTQEISACGGELYHGEVLHKNLARMTMLIKKFGTTESTILQRRYTPYTEWESWMEDMVIYNVNDNSCAKIVGYLKGVKGLSFFIDTCKFKGYFILATDLLKKYKFENQDRCGEKRVKRIDIKEQYELL